MADNTSQTGSDTIATDDIGGVKYPRAKVVWGVDGSAVDASDSNPLPISAKNMPAADRTTDSIGAALQTGVIMAQSGSTITALTPKFTYRNTGQSVTDDTVIAAVTGKKLRVLALAVVCGSPASSVLFQSGTANDKTPTLTPGANGGFVLPFNPVGWFETNAGEALTLTTGAGSQTGTIVVYVEA